MPRDGLRHITPPLQVAIVGTDWSFLIPAAGDIAGSGLQARMQLWNGQAQDNQLVELEVKARVSAYAGEVSTRIAVPLAVVKQAMVDTAVQIQEFLLQGDGNEPEGTKKSQATLLVELATEAEIALFHTPDLEPYATIQVGGHAETWPLKVKGFRLWLGRLFFEAFEKAPSSQGVQDALGILAARALCDNPELPVSTRIAPHGEAIYLDLANDHWQAVEITASGWRVVDEVPVKFRRPKGMLPLPMPGRGGSLQALRPFLNVGSDADWQMLVSWLAMTFRPRGPYPILVLYGEQGSAKSSVARILRRLIDPNSAELRRPPRDERDVVLAATNGWVVGLDNLSGLPDWLSDALCCIATGTGFGTRELYTDGEEVLFSAMRPIVINGIEEPTTRGDFLDRALSQCLPAIPQRSRREEAEFWAAFTQAQPGILGSLLEAVSLGMRQLPRVKLDGMPRMADFAKWACAVAPACGWTQDAFPAAYQGVREASHDLILEGSRLGQAVRDFVEEGRPWEGTATELLDVLTARVKEETRRHNSWPKNGTSLSGALRRLAPTLRAVGIEVEFAGNTGKSRKRLLRLSVVGHAAGQQRERGTV